jgi:hypothetical protein
VCLTHVPHVAQALLAYLRSATAASRPQRAHKGSAAALVRSARVCARVRVLHCGGVTMHNIQAEAAEAAAEAAAV